MTKKEKEDFLSELMKLKIKMKSRVHGRKNPLEEEQELNTIYENICSLQNIGGLPILQIPDKTVDGLSFTIDKNSGFILVHRDFKFEKKETKNGS